MKNSGIEWIGEIPADWNIIKVKNLFNIGRGRVIAKTELEDSGYPIYSSQTKNNGVLGYISTYDYDIDQLTWTTDGANAGTVFLRTGKYNCTNVCGTLAPKNNDNNLLYMKYALEYIAVFHKRADTNGYKIMNNEMADIKITIPPIHEQNKIADFLDSKVSEIDKMIAETKSSIENYKEYKQSVITEAITKGLNKNVQMKDSGINWIGQVPADWEVVKIKYVSKVSRGLFNHRPRNDERYYNGAYPFIQTGDVASADKYITKYSQTLNELGKSVSKEFPKGTLTMTIAANIGDVSILGFDSYFPDSIIGFVPNDNIQNIYLYYIFKAMKEQFINASVMNTQLNLNIERVREIFIPITYNQDKQQEIIDYLDKQCAEIDNLISEKEALIVNLEEYKKSLIYEYVTGKKAVN